MEVSSERERSDWHLHLASGEMEWGGYKSLRWVKKMPSPAYCSLEPAPGFPKKTALKEGVEAMLCPLWSSTVKELHIQNHKPSGVLATGATDPFIQCEKKVHRGGCTKFCLLPKPSPCPAFSHCAHPQNKGLVYTPEATTLVFVQRSSLQLCSLALSGSARDRMSETSIPLAYIIHSCEINLALILDSLDVFQ